MQTKAAVLQELDHAAQRPRIRRTTTPRIFTILDRSAMRTLHFHCCRSNDPRQSTPAPPIASEEAGSSEERIEMKVCQTRESTSKRSVTAVSAALRTGPLITVLRRQCSPMFEGSPQPDGIS